MKWSEILPQEALDTSKILEERALRERETGKIIYPPQNQIFRALQLTTPDNLKVCIVGQDPYHTPGVANGLAFSTNPGLPIPPSLRNIYKELVDDIGCDYPQTGDLTPWAEQGVLLINSSLTVYEHQPNSHFGWGWQQFTQAILKSAVQLPQPIVFVLWGANAFELKDSLIVRAAIPKGNIILQNLIKKDIVMSSHPSPFSVSKTCQGMPAFKGSKPFSTINSLLRQRGSEVIDWRL